MTKEALRDATVVSPSSPTSNVQDICTETQTDWLSHGLMDPYFYNIKVHEKEKRKGSYSKEMKRNTLCSYLKKMITQGFLPRPNHLTFLSYARVFTLKPEYKKENRLDEKDPLGTKESENEGHIFQSPVLLQQSRENRLDEKDPLGTKESENEGHIFQSPILLQQSRNSNTVKPSSMVGRALYVAFCYF
jgi:hypothetical protein